MPGELRILVRDHLLEVFEELVVVLRLLDELGSFSVLYQGAHVLLRLSQIFVVRTAFELIV